MQFQTVFSGNYKYMKNVKFTSVDDTQLPQQYS